MKTPKQRTQSVWVYVLVAMTAVAVCSVWAQSLTLAQGQSPDEIVGIPWQGEPGITESVANIMSREAEVQAMTPRTGNEPLKPVEAHKKLRVHRENLPQNPDARKYEETAPTQDSLLSTLAPQTVGTSFVGATLTDSGFIPPDSMGAAGPTQFLICVNGRIRTFTKSGAQDGALDTTTDTFFNSVRNSSDTSDPTVIFDRLSQRWYITMINVSSSGNRILIAASSGPTITGPSTFSFFQFQHDLVGPTPNSDTGGFADFPRLGIDNNALYIGVNVFNSSGTTQLGTSGYVVRKSALLLGSLVVTAFRQLATSTGSGPYSPQGVDNDDPNATEGYFIGVDNALFGLLDIRRITNPGGTPGISGNLSITVSPTSFPRNVPAQGSNNPLDAVDDRLSAALLKNGSLWTAHNIGVNSTGSASNHPDRDAMRWYEIINTTSTPTIRQSGTLFDPSSNQIYYWMGSVATSGQGHSVLGSSYGGATAFAGVALSGRLATDPLGTMQAPTLIPSVFSYNVQNVNPQRWGDFSFTSVDPTDNMTMWTVQEFTNATNSWGVYVAKLMAPPPATPSNASPASANQGATNINITVTGTSTGGSGFYDPPISFPNHISATVDGGGVTVNSVTFTDPSIITLNLSIASNAPPGTRTITVTNPDGQSATSATGIFTVIQNQNHPPSADSLMSVNITTAPGAAQSFTAVYSDPDGYMNISDASLSLSGGAHNERLDYNPATNQFTLMGASGDCSPGQAATLSDGNLTLNCSASSASGSGTTLTLTFNLTPQPPLSGFAYLLIISVIDQGGLSDSKTPGTWTVNRPPSAVNCTPMNSTTAVGTVQTFVCVYSDPDGWQNIAAANLYLSGNGGVHNEWLHYLVAPNFFTMMGSNDFCSPGQAKTLTSGFLTLDCGTSSISGSGNTLTVTFIVTPQAPSSGIQYNNFSAASDQAGAANAIFAGTWGIQ
jgi:hypothetical protein